LLAEEVPGRIVSSRALGNLAILSRLDRVDEVRELNGILDEENRNVVADEVKVAFVGVASEQSDFAPEQK
jgi:hypothetical protein